MAFSLETVAKICRGERRASPLSLPSSLVLTLLITGSPAGLVSLPSNRQHILTKIMEVRPPFLPYHYWEQHKLLRTLFSVENCCQQVMRACSFSRCWRLSKFCISPASDVLCKSLKQIAMEWEMKEKKSEIKWKQQEKSELSLQCFKIQ